MTQSKGITIMNKHIVVFAVALLAGCVARPNDSDLGYAAAPLTEANLSHAIKRYEIATAGEDLELPTESKIMTAKAWKGSIYVWAHVSTETPDTEIHTVSVYQTGDDVPQLPGRFVASVFLDRKAHHVFVTEPAP